VIYGSPLSVDALKMCSAFGITDFGNPWDESKIEMRERLMDNLI